MFVARTSLFENRNSGIIIALLLLDVQNLCQTFTEDKLALYLSHTLYCSHNSLTNLFHFHIHLPAETRNSDFDIHHLKWIPRLRTCPISDWRWIKPQSVNGLFGWQMDDWSGWWIAITRRWRRFQLMGSINRGPTLAAPDLLNSRTHTSADWWWNTMVVSGPINVTSVTTPPYTHLIWGITRKESTRRSQRSKLPINGEYKSCSGHCPDSTYWIVARTTF